MILPESPASGRTRFMNKLAAWVTARGLRAQGFVSQPVPRGIGMQARGRQVLAGNFVIAGHVVEAPGQSPWDIKAPDPAVTAGLQGFEWLEHLAALGDRAARETAQGWTAQWIARHGGGSGPGWTPALAGQRLRRWISHALFLLSGDPPGGSEPLFRALAHHAAFVARRWQAAPEGLPRIEALCGLLLAALSLEGMEGHLPQARSGLVRACRSLSDTNGTIPSRNPEELLQILQLLVWAAEALEGAGRMVEQALVEGIESAAITLRTLRHKDGALPRFHGGDSGDPGRLDRALGLAGNVVSARDGRAMGYGRLQGGRTSVIVDAAPPPMGAGSEGAHASTLAFELTSHRRAVIVSCGAGAPFGADWERAGRATASHSTLALDGLSSARMGPTAQGPAPLHDGPAHVGVERETEPSHSAFLLSHDGYLASHGLTHLRRLDLSRDGRALLGEDTLAALSPAERRVFDRVMARGAGTGVGYAIRFHLHPEAEATLDLNASAVSVTLRSGEVWVLRQEGAAQMTLEPSVYFEPGRLRPRATVQIVLSGRAQGYTSQIVWSVTKAQDTPLALRDIGREDPLALPDL